MQIIYACSLLQQIQQYYQIIRYCNFAYYQNSMIGFKGCIPRNILTNESFQSLVKKTEQHRKSAQLLIDFYLLILKFEQNRAAANQKIVSQSDGALTDPFGKSLLSLLVLTIQQQSTTYKTQKQSIQQSVLVNNKIFSDISNEVAKLEELLQNYKQFQQVVSERAKKYYKIHKTMLNAIDLYKNSFSDVNLIYNMDEKVRRYQNCQNLYKSAKDEHKIVNDYSVQLTVKKQNIVRAYNNLLQQFEKGLKQISLTAIQKGKQIMFYTCFSSNNLTQLLTKYQQQSLQLKRFSLFDCPFEQQNLDYFNQPKSIKKGPNSYLPLIVQYNHLLKQENLKLFNVQVPAYLKILQDRLKAKKAQDKKMFQIIIGYFRNVEKVIATSVKDILIGFQKNRKKIAECFGNRLVTFLKSINSICELLVGLNQKLNAQVNPIFQSIQNFLSQQSKLIKLFIEQANSNVERFLIKKYLKKNEQPQLQNESKQINIRLIRKQMSQKAQFIKHLIAGFHQKMQKNTAKINNSYDQLLFICGRSTSQFYSYCNQYYELYFGEQQFPKNMDNYEQDYIKVRKRNKQYYSQLPFHSICQDNSKIVFDGDFNKIEDFKKIKKPVYNSLSSPDPKSDSGSAKDPNEDEKSFSGLQMNRADNSKANSQYLKANDKNIQFLFSKITLKQNEKYIKSFSCALAQKIILQGKIYITSQRICFHSNFNSNNIFFGKTFIQFPKTDIKKIEKRKNSLLLDNSISFTTVNGQVFFTYFFSRDEAYDLICKTFSFNLDDHVYEYEENQIQQIPEFLIENEEKDDINKNQIEARKQQIEKLMVVYPFSLAADIQLIEQGLSALKLFKIFFHNNEIIFGNKKYQNFLKYFKQMIDHKNLEISQWAHPLSEILNQSNIKQNAPYCSRRKIKATIPMSSSGVPFMPKTAQSEENQSLYFFSKHKFVLQSQIETKGAPYTDTFKIELKLTVQSNQDGKCKITVQMYVNFLKNTMMKSVIESKSKQETIAASKLQLNQFKRYFELLHSRPKKNENKSIQQVKLQLENANKQVQSLKDQKAQLINKVKQLQQKQKRFKYLLIGSLVLNLLILMLYIF